EVQPEEGAVPQVPPDLRRVRGGGGPRGAGHQVRVITGHRGQRIPAVGRPGGQSTAPVWSRGPATSEPSGTGPGRPTGGATAGSVAPARVAHDRRAALRSVPP